MVWLHFRSLWRRIALETRHRARLGLLFFVLRATSLKSQSPELELELADALALSHSKIWIALHDSGGGR